MAYKNLLKICMISVLTLVLTQQAQADGKLPPLPVKKPAFKAAAHKPVKAHTFQLRDALAEAYQKNPTLLAARAELRSVDETYSQAVSGFRPSVTGGAAYVSSHQNGDNSVATHADPKTLSLQMTQSLYSGGSTLAGIEVSESTIKAQRALLQTTEQQVLLAAVTAYTDVLRDQEILRLSVNNENVLKDRLKESDEKFKLGTITKTDVSQSQSRHASATAARVAALADVRSSRATFEKVVGVPADHLQMPDVRLSLPPSLDAALAEAEKNNPDMALAQYASKAAIASTRAIAGEMLPQVSVTGAMDRIYDPSGSADNDRTAESVTLRATIPLYTGGATYSRIRQARQIETQRRMEADEAHKDVRATVIDAWETVTAARAEIDARKAQLTAAQMARDGVKVEADYGSRTTLDLLDAEQELLNAQVASVTAHHDQVVASYGLLAAIGRLNAQSLKLDVTPYDPLKNFQRVSAQWFGARIGVD